MKYLHIALFLTLGIMLNVTQSFAAPNNGDNEPVKSIYQERHEMQTRTMTMAQTKMNELDITMEVVEENADSVDDVTNTIELPAQIRERDRIRERSRLHDEQANMEGARNQIQEMHEQRHEMHNEIKQQQAETMQHMKEQTQGQGGHGMGN